MSTNERAPEPALTMKTIRDALANRTARTKALELAASDERDAGSSTEHIIQRANRYLSFLQGDDGDAYPKDAGQPKTSAPKFAVGDIVASTSALVDNRYRVEKVSTETLDVRLHQSADGRIVKDGPTFNKQDIGIFVHAEPHQQPAPAEPTPLSGCRFAVPHQGRARHRRCRRGARSPGKIQRVAELRVLSRQ